MFEQISNLNIEGKSMKDESLNRIKRLQEENELLRPRCSKLQDKVVLIESG